MKYPKILCPQSSMGCFTEVIYLIWPDIHLMLRGIADVFKQSSNAHPQSVPIIWRMFLSPASEYPKISFRSSPCLHRSDLHRTKNPITSCLRHLEKPSSQSLVAIAPVASHALVKILLHMLGYQKIPVSYPLKMCLAETIHTFVQNIHLMPRNIFITRLQSSNILTLHT